jgi:hypothetical protein
MSYSAGAVSDGTPPPSPKRKKNKKSKKRNSASDSDGVSDDDRELSNTGASAQDDQRRGRVSLTESQIDAKLEELAAEVAKADAEKQKYESASKKLRIEMQQLLDGDSPDAPRDGTVVTAASAAAQAAADAAKRRQDEASAAAARADRRRHFAAVASSLPHDQASRTHAQRVRFAGEPARRLPPVTSYPDDEDSSADESDCELVLPKPRLHAVKALAALAQHVTASTLSFHPPRLPSTLPGPLTYVYTSAIGRTEAMLRECRPVQPHVAYNFTDFIAVLNLLHEFVPMLFGKKQSRSQEAAYIWPIDPSRMIQVAMTLNENKLEAQGLEVAIDATKKFPNNYLVWATLDAMKSATAEQKAEALAQMKRLDPLNPNLK